MARDTVPVRPRRRWWAVAATPIPLRPLDVVTTPGVTTVAAYGLRKLRNSFDGPVINVRRSSDNATMDIGLRGAGDLDVQTLSNFIGAGTGFVAIWYDQSLNKSNATAIGGLAANQSPIVLAVTPNGKPAVNVTATTQGMVAATAASQAVVSMSMVASRTGNLTAYAVPISFDGGCPGIAYNNVAGGGVVFGNVGVTITAGAVITDNAFHSAIGVMNGAATQVATEAGTSAAANITGATGAVQIDLIGRSGYGYQGYLAEAIIWNGALGSGDVANLFANQRAYYGF